MFRVPRHSSLCWLSCIWKFPSNISMYVFLQRSEYYLFSIITYTSYTVQYACETKSSIQRCVQNPFKQLRWIVLRYILDVWQVPEYASVNGNWSGITELGKYKARFSKVNFKELLGYVSKNICTDLFQLIRFIFKGMLYIILVSFNSLNVFVFLGAER